MYENVLSIIYISYGKPIYVTIYTRSNIAQIIKVVSILMTNLGGEHWSAIKRTLVCVYIYIYLYIYSGRSLRELLREPK